MLECLSAFNNKPAQATTKKKLSMPTCSVEVVHAVSLLPLQQRFCGLAADCAPGAPDVVTRFGEGDGMTTRVAVFLFSQHERRDLPDESEGCFSCKQWLQEETLLEHFDGSMGILKASCLHPPNLLRLLLDLRQASS